MDFLQRAAMDGAQKALVEKLASIDRFANDLKTIHEDLSDGIEITAGKIEKLLQSLSETVATLHKEVMALKAAKPAEIKVPEVDLSAIEDKISRLSKELAPQPSQPVNLDPVMKALDKLARHKPAAEEWVFNVERQKWSGRIESVSAKRVA